MELDSADLNTETFTNARGWTVIRVTHLPTSLSVERTRGDGLESPVQAQTECVAELRRLVEGHEGGPARPSKNGTAKNDDPPVTRAEFDELVARVAKLEQLLER